MDDFFTLASKISEKNVTSSCGEKYLSPKESSLVFIRSFARNFRIDKNTDISIQGFFLN